MASPRGKQTPSLTSDSSAIGGSGGTPKALNTPKTETGARSGTRTSVADATSRSARRAALNKQNQAGPTVAAKDVQRWERVQAQLKAKLGQEAYQSWFGRCRLESVSKSQLTLSVPTTFLKSWIRTHYQAMLLEMWQKQLEDILRIDVVVRSAVRAANTENGGMARPVPPQQQAIDKAPLSQPALPPFTNNAPVPNRTLREGAANLPSPPSDRGGAVDPRTTFAGSPLDPNYTFATLVEGASNRMACAAARSVAEADGAALRFNPLFIHANVGLGKTHLLQAIAWAANERNNGVRMLYLTAEYFMWRFASAIRDQSALSFKESLRDIDLLLIDDMQFLQGKSIQQEFCHLLNALIDSAKQVVVAADRPPSELESLDARVRSRLQGGVALEVKAPNIEMRREMLELRYRDAQREDSKLAIADGVLDFVAEKVASSGRDLEGAFNQLLIQHRFSDGPVDMDVIERMLGHLVQSGEQKRVRIEDIQKVVARHYHVSKNDLLSNRRTRVIVRPRQIAMYLAKILTPRSLPEIGRRFGGRDHTTVLHAVRKIEKLLESDHMLAQEIELLKRLIHELGQ
ncbi:chromosomal replication initiator protein DnaA [Pseudahrensia aquimaris]|uniref:Chromosomal replication initiator protein DnaA n=1 Tax=Pseudahrensia aquimaris TaxID=744461 RepID=A0ABW3FIP5_9HYPH